MYKSRIPFVLILLLVSVTLTIAQNTLPFPRTGDVRFDPTGWLYPPDASASLGDFYGFSSAITGSSTLDAIAVIGAPNATANAQSNAGVAHIYAYNLSGDWELLATLTSPTPAANSQFGYSVDITSDATSIVIAIGAPGATVGATADAGKVYIFRSNGAGGFDHDQTLTASVESAGRYGTSVSLAGIGDNLGHLLVGEPVGMGNVHFYTQLAGDFTLYDTYESPQTGAGFGHTVKLIPYYGGAPDVYDFLIGAPYNDNLPNTDNGAVYYYVYDGISDWTLEQTITASAPASNALFGWSLDAYTPASSLGAILAVGAPGHPRDTGTVIDNAGLVDTFRYAGSTWSWSDELVNPNPPTTDMSFGAAVSIIQLTNADYSILVGQPYGLLTNAALPAGVNTAGVVHEYLDDDGFGDTQWDFVYNTNVASSEFGVSDYYGYTLTQALIDTEQILFIGAPNTRHPRVVGTPRTGGVDTYEPTQPALSLITDAPLEISEDGQTEEFSVMLRAEPSAIVTVDIISDPQCSADDDEPIVIRPPDITDVTLTFDNTNWNIPISIYVTAEDDTTSEGDHTCAVNFIVTSSDTGYDGLVVAPLIFSVTDNDLPVGIELVRNNGMEDPKSNNPQIPDQWIFKKFAGQDTRTCPGVGSPMVYDGACSVQMAGTKDAPRSILRSTRTKIDLVDNLGLPLSNDDELYVRFRYKLNAKTDALFRLVAFRNLGGDRTVLARVELPHPSDANYDQWLTFEGTFPLTTTNFKQLRLIIKDFSTKGTWWVDDVNMVYIDNCACRTDTTNQPDATGSQSDIFRAP